ncbi:Uncharacterised protein [Vibrio cholerae]|nr:Uncharacterised protein [Vibrio cholerae]
MIRDMYDLFHCIINFGCLFGKFDHSFDRIVLSF